MKRENPIPIPRTCECGTLMQKCEFFMDMASRAFIRVPNGYNFPNSYSASAYFCENCGKVTLFADGVGKKTDESRNNK